MENLIKFGYELVGVPKVIPFLLLLLIYLFKSAKSHFDETRIQKTNRISDMLAELDKGSSQNNQIWFFRVEQTFQNRFGFQVDYPIISYFLKQRTPSKYIQQYIDGFQYLEFNEKHSKLTLNKKYSILRLSISSVVYLIGYFIFAFIGLGAIVLLPTANFHSEIAFSMYLFTILAMLIVAYLCLDQSSRPTSAIKLVTTVNCSNGADDSSSGGKRNKK